MRPTPTSFASLSIISSDAERDASLVWGIPKFLKIKLQPKEQSCLEINFLAT